jgi:cobyrinic acid a,c-diamide synthase
MERGHGMDGLHDGLVIGNLLAGFCHLRNTTANPWVVRFVKHVRDRKMPIYRTATSSK